MVYGEQQKKEIETIRERTFKLRLSDADVKRLFEKAGEAGMSVSELLQNFIGDLVDGTYSNGSDERMYADQWFDRCWFSPHGEPHSLLQRLSLYRGDLDETVYLWEEMQSLKEELEDEDLEPEERADIEQQIVWNKERYDDNIGSFTDPEEWQKVLAFHAEMKKMLTEE